MIDGAADLPRLPRVQRTNRFDQRVVSSHGFIVARQAQPNRSVDRWSGRLPIKPEPHLLAGLNRLGYGVTHQAGILGDWIVEEVGNGQGLKWDHGVGGFNLYVVDRNRLPQGLSGCWIVQDQLQGVPAGG